MAGDHDDQADPIPPPDGATFAVALSVGLVTLLGLIAVAALIVAAA